MSPVRRAAWAAIGSWHHARFVLWTARLRASLRLRGGRLTVHAPHGVRLRGLPRLEFDRWGDTGAATTVLRIGRDVTIGRGVVLSLNARSANELALGDRAVLGDLVRVQLRNGAVRLGPDTRVRAFAVFKTEGEIVTHGNNEISFGTTIHAARRVELGSGTGLAERVSIVDSDHVVDGSDRHFYNAPLRVGPVVLGANVFVAAGAIVTRWTRIAENSVVGAGAVVTGEREFPPSSLIAGAPARVVRSLLGGDQPSAPSER